MYENHWDIVSFSVFMFSILMIIFLEQWFLLRSLCCIEWIFKLLAHLLPGLKSREAYRGRIRKTKPCVCWAGNKGKRQFQNGQVQTICGLPSFSLPPSVFFQVGEKASSECRLPVDLGAAQSKLIKARNKTLFLSFIFLNLIPAVFETELHIPPGKPFATWCYENDGIYSFKWERWPACYRPRGRKKNSLTSVYFTFWSLKGWRAKARVCCVCSAVWMWYFQNICHWANSISWNWNGGCWAGSWRQGWPGALQSFACFVSDPSGSIL